MLAAVATAVLVLTGPSAAAGAGSDRSGVHFKGPAAVGALFTWVDGKPVRHFCTATVVHSPQQDLLITAAHCVYRLKIGSFVFAPGWYKGTFPHGTWPVSKVYVDKAWAAKHDANDDFAFLVAGRRGKIERHTGAERLRTYQKLPVQAQVIGYPDSSSQPITCTGPARAFDPRKLRQIKFDCGGYTDGTSGGPFLVDVSKKTGVGKVFGVIGGFEEGGNTPAISYSSQFRTNIKRLYQMVISRKPGTI
jgi:V8-like Glu-specific endopeptidase